MAVGTDQFDELTQQARQALGAGNPALARQQFMQALALKPNSPDACHGLATANFHLGELDSAIFYFKEVIRIDPHRAGAYVNLGAVYNRQGNTEEAIKALRKAIQVDPKRAEAYYNLGLIYRKQGQSELAIQAYREAVHINPQMGDALYNMANLLLEMGRYAQAAGYYQQVLQLAPESENARLGLAQATAAQQAEAAGQAAAGPQVAPPSAGSTLSNTRLSRVTLSRTLDPQRDGPFLHGLHQATIESEDRAREFVRILEGEVEPSLKDLSAVLLYPEKTGGQVREKLGKFEIALSHLRGARKAWQDAMKKLRDLSDQLA